jgi:hypothetical protein
MLTTTLNVLAPVLFVLLLGYLGWRRKAFDADQVAGINKLTLDFALPATLFVGVASIPRAELTEDGHFLMAVLLTLAGLYLAALLIGRKVLRLGSGASALFALGASFPAAPFFGPAVLGGYFGQKSAIAIASISVVANLILVPITVVVLEVAQGSRIPPDSSMVSEAPADENGAGEAKASTAGTAAVVRNGLLHAIRRPYVLAPVLAVVLVLVGVRVPPLVNSMLDLIGHTTSGISLFVAGLLLSAFRPRVNGVVAVNVILKSLVQPALMLALVGLLSLSKPLAAEAVASVALPSAVITPMLAARYGTYQSEAGTNMLMTAILMMLVLPVCIFIVR